MTDFKATEAQFSPVGSVFSGQTANVPVTLAQWIQTALTTPGGDNDLASVLDWVDGRVVSQDDLQTLQHLTRDLHIVRVTTVWSAVPDTDADVFWTVPVNGAITLVDTDFDNAGASITIPATTSERTTYVFVRLPAGTDTSALRMFSSSQGYAGANVWGRAEDEGVTIPSGATYDYWMAVINLNETAEETWTLQKREDIDHTRYDGALGGEALAAVEQAQEDADSNTGDIDDLRHLTRDLHSPAPSNNWVDAADSDGDMYQALGSSTDALTDANFNNEGASLTIASNASTQVYVRLAIGEDHTDYRIVFSDGFARSREGNLWTVPSYPAAASTTYQYWRADGFNNYSGGAVKLQKREEALNNTFFSGRLEGAALTQIDDLQHLTRDLHTLVGPPGWEDAADADGDVYQVIDPGSDITLTDANFNGNGASIELPEHQNDDTIIFVRLPAASDPTDFRITFDDRQPTTGNTWREKEGPTDTFKYYRVTEVNNYGNSNVQLEKKSASIGGTRYDGSLGGEALDQLPPTILAGTREPTTNDGKDGDFWVAGLDNGSTLSISENVLGAWVEIGRATRGGNGSGGPDATARAAAAAAQATADAALSRSGGTMTGKITLDGAPTVDLHAATKKYVDDNIGSGSPSEGGNGGGSSSPETLYEDATAHTWDHDGFRTITLSRAPAAGTVLQFSLTSEPTNLMANTIYMSSDAFLALEEPDSGATGYNANWPSPGNKAWVGVAPAAVDAAARITYTVGGNEWSHLTFLFVRRQSNTSMDVLYTFDGIDRSATLKIEELPNGSEGGGQLKDLETLPAVADYEEGDLVAVDDTWYKLGITDESVPNIFAGEVGRDVFNTTAGERWRGISNSQSPNGFSTDGEFTANPNNTLSLLLASSSRHIRVAMKRSVYEAAKGSDFSPSDHIAIKVTMADGTTTDEAVLAYYNAYERTDNYIIWQHRHASDNYNLYDEAAGNDITIEFFTTSGSPPAATTTPLLTHTAGLKHWLHWPSGEDPTEDGRTALALAQANAARLDALDMHVDGVAEPIHSQTYDENTALLAPLAGSAGNFAISQAFNNILTDDLLVIDWKKCDHLNHHDEYVVPGSDTDSGRMYLHPRNFDNTEWNGEVLYGLDRAIQDNGAADTLNSWIVGSLVYEGSTLTFGLHLQQGGTRTNRNLKPQAGFSITLRIYRNSAQAVPTSAPFKGIELGRLVGHDSNHLGEQPWTALATGVTTADGPDSGYSHWLSIPMHSYLTLPTGLGIILEMSRTGVTTPFSQVFIPWHAIGNWDSRGTSYPMFGGSWKASGTSNNDRIEVRGRINAGRIELQAACGGADDEGTLHAYIAM